MFCFFFSHSLIPQFIVYVPGPKLYILNSPVKFSGFWLHKYLCSNIVSNFKGEKRPESGWMGLLKNEAKISQQSVPIKINK